MYCSLYVLVFYSYVTRMLLVCYPYVTQYVTRMLLVCFPYVLVCYSHVLVCYPYVLVWRFSHAHFAWRKKQHFAMLLVSDLHEWSHFSSWGMHLNVRSAYGEKSIQKLFSLTRYMWNRGCYTVARRYGWQEQYRLSYCFCHENIKSIYSSYRVIFYLLLWTFWM